MNTSDTKILALKYRPRIFGDLIGQEVIAETIFNSIKLGKTPNAYLLTGIRGVGKTTTARLIAKALNCTNDSDQGKNYNKKSLCDNCKQIESANHIDVLEMDAASKTGIDDVRELIENSKYNPTSAKYKIFIIDEVHMLSKQAFNGLLKTLEEPPQNLKFILATTEPRKIPVTILSRCQRFDLRRVTLEKIYEHLKNIANLEKGKISENGLKIIAKASEGSVRDAISLLDRTIIFQSLKPETVVEAEDVRKMLGLADKTKMLNLIGYVFLGDEKNSLKLLKDLIDDGLDAKNFLNDFLELIYLFSRRINLGRFESDVSLSEAEINLIEKISTNLNMEDIGLFWQLTIKTIEDLKTVSNENIALEMFLIQLIHLKRLDSDNDNKTVLQNEIQVPQVSKDKVEENSNKTKQLNFTKDQMKNTEQIKSISKKESENEKKFQVRSFEDLIKITEKNKEMELKYDLERNVRLVNFEYGKIDINFNENLNKDFIKRLSQCLLNWTGTRWIITLSKDTNNKTFHQKKVEEKEKILNDEKKDEIFGEISEVFPDVDLVDVRNEDE